MAIPERKHYIVKPIDDLVKYIASTGVVELAYLFGSTVEKKGRKPDDVDVAFLHNETLNVNRRLRLQLNAIQKVEEAFGRRADVVFLNDASSFLKYQVLKFGKLIYESKRGADARLRFKVMTEYFDALALQNFFYSRIIERRRHG